ncbi:MAG: hypothetical protein HUU35_20330, partial [Armatimonadetes bacterium]|nr:hypothetical protein [Armatimonadota bacterium]
SGLAALPVALVGYLLAARRAEGAVRRAVTREAALSLGVMALLVAPYLARNAMLYGRLLVKTTAPYGAALDHVAAGRFEPLQLLWLTLSQTWLSIWSQPDWLPGWPLRTPGGPELPLVGVVLFYGLLSGLVLLALVGLHRGLPQPLRDFLTLGAVLLASLVVGHQLAFWAQDIEFNMGGRYLLSGMLVIALAVTAGLERLHARLPALWLALLLTMNLVAVPTILYILNPHYAPGWKVLTLR